MKDIMEQLRQLRLGKPISGDTWELKRAVADRMAQLGELIYTSNPTSNEDLQDLLVQMDKAIEALGNEEHHDGKLEWMRSGGYSLEDMFAELHPFTGFGSLVGPRLELVQDSGDLIGKVKIPVHFEGPPGAAHGGALAGIFDQFLTVFLIHKLRHGFTEKLTISFFQPTPLREDLTVRAKIIKENDRGTRAVCDIVSAQGVTASCVGDFLNI